MTSIGYTYDYYSENINGTEYIFVIESKKNLLFFYLMQICLIMRGVPPFRGRMPPITDAIIIHILLFFYLHNRLNY